MTFSIGSLTFRRTTPVAPKRPARNNTPAPVADDNAPKPVTFIFSGGSRNAETQEATRDLLQWYMDKHAHACTRVKVRHMAGADVHNNGARFIGNPGPTIRNAAHKAFSYALSELGTVRSNPSYVVRPAVSVHVAGSCMPDNIGGSTLDGSKIHL